ncbi:MAG: hypothetical protein EHM68_12950 [Lysobacterales bacterium]|nr:MAG: hypothetical protein EHM68_12950 [Xanthomonadales bacterium]
MKRWRISAAAWLALALIGLVAACSDDSVEPPAEGGESTEAVVTEREVESQQRPARKGDFVLTDNIPLTTGLAAAYEEACIDEDADDFACSVFRSLVVVELVMALEEMERARDQRGADGALAALDITNEPEVLVAAMRVLGQFPDTPGIAEKVWPLLLESPYLQVQEMAARLLASNPDPTLAGVGSYWSLNHTTLYAENAYQEYPDFAPHYADMGFPDYPDAEWFSPADSDRSIGWSTGDDFATVSAWLTEELETESMDFRAWAERLSQESTAMFQVDPDKQAEVQRLIEEWTKTQDMAVLEQMQKLQEEMSAPALAAGEIADKGVGNFGPPNDTEAFEQIRYFIAEERAGHVARLVIAYPLTSLNRTVIQHSWNLTDYPGAWPPAEEGAAQDQ